LDGKYIEVRIGFSEVNCKVELRLGHVLSLCSEGNVNERF